jgi:hypothetical protein
MATFGLGSAWFSLAVLQSHWWIPHHFYIGGGPAATTVTPAAALALTAAIAGIFAFPPRYVIVPVLLVLMFVPMGNVVVIAGLHLPPTRIIALVGWMRILISRAMGRGASFRIDANSIDRAFTWNICCHAVAFILLWRSFAAVSNQFGYLLGEIPVYFLIRAVVRDERDARLVIRLLLLVACVMAGEMAYERLHAYNLFGAILGGISIIPEIRNGTVRAQGTFGHAILAGTFGAILLPLFVWLWRDKFRIGACLGVLAVLIIVYTSGSSTPDLALAASLVGICCWRIRTRMQLLRRGIVVTLLGLQMVMQAPVWFLIEHMDVTGSSSGYQRAELVNEFITHFFNWWLIGTRTNGTWGLAMFDTSNWYVSQGESGGLLTFILFIVLIVRAFSRVGKARRATAGSKSEWLMWLLGASLFANVVAFFGISYWDQTEVIWFTLLALIIALCRPTRSANRSRSESQPIEMVAPNREPLSLDKGDLEIIHRGAPLPDVTPTGLVIRCTH